MKADALKFAKEKYFIGYSGTRSIQENFNLITSFIQDSADKLISRLSFLVPWLTPEIRKKIRKNANHAKAKKNGSAKFRIKFETLRRNIK